MKEQQEYNQTTEKMRLRRTSRGPILAKSKAGQGCSCPSLSKCGYLQTQGCTNFPVVPRLSLCFHCEYLVPFLQKRFTLKIYSCSERSERSGSNSPLVDSSGRSLLLTLSSLCFSSGVMCSSSLINSLVVHWTHTLLITSLGCLFLFCAPLSQHNCAKHKGFSAWPEQPVGAARRAVTPQCPRGTAGVLSTSTPGGTGLCRAAPACRRGYQSHVQD